MDAAALWCNICPKRPYFSDVSHLLTHISSKAHLAHYFKLQVRSHQELEARNLLKEYDQWYKVNDLEKLLSDRMTSKESRKRKGRGRGTHVSKRRGKLGDRSVPIGRGPEPQSANIPDPRLTRPCVSTAFDDTGNDDGAVDGHDDAPVKSETPSSRDQFSSARPAKSVFSPTYQWGAQNSKAPDNDSKYPPCDASRWSSHLDVKANIRQPSFRNTMSPDPFVDNDESETDLDDEDRQRAEAMTRLKGILWPGMDIFDSATEQMRRRRNQKKDGNALKMMEKTSEGIEPTELVFSPTGILRKQRVISGNVEDSSPLKGETPVPKPPKQRVARVKREPLSHSDPNTTIRPGSEKKRTRRKRQHSDRSLEELSKRALPPLESPTANRPQHPCGDLYPLFDDNDDEFKMSLPGFDQKPGSSFSVFNDEGKQRKLGSKNRLRDVGAQPVLTLPQSGQFIPVQRSGCRKYSPQLPGLPSGKENLEPILTSHGRIDHHVGWQNLWARPPQFEDDQYSSRYLYGDSRHVDFNPFGGNDLSGYTCNPLAISYLHHCHQEPLYIASHFSGRNSPRTKREVSTDSTIPDTERDEIGRLYLDES
ncbi:hypothetical protein V8E54_011572 [Elaphomyces granulatus]|jgi:hypothetical protein